MPIRFKSSKKHRDCLINNSSILQSVCTLFFINSVFSTPSQCCFTFSWIELQMLLRCCFIHITIIIMRHISHIVYLCPCLTLGLFVSYLCDIFFISASFSLPFIIYPYLNRCTCFLYIFNNISYHFWMITKMNKRNSFPIGKVQPRGFA